MSKMSYTQDRFVSFPIVTYNVPIRGINNRSVSQNNVVDASTATRSDNVKTVDILLLALLYGIIWAWCIYS